MVPFAVPWFGREAGRSCERNSGGSRRKSGAGCEADWDGSRSKNRIACEGDSGRGDSPGAFTSERARAISRGSNDGRDSRDVDWTDELGEAFSKPSEFAVSCAKKAGDSVAMDSSGATVSGVADGGAGEKMEPTSGRSLGSVEGRVTLDARRSKKWLIPAPFGHRATAGCRRVPESDLRSSHMRLPECEFRKEAVWRKLRARPR